MRGLRPAGDLRGCEEDGSRDGLDFVDDSDGSPKPVLSEGLDVVVLDGTSPQGESVPSKSILANFVDGAWICAAGSSSGLGLELLFVGIAG